MARTPTYEITPKDVQLARVGEPMLLRPVVPEWQRTLAWLRLWPLPPPVSAMVVSKIDDVLTLGFEEGQQITVTAVSR